MTRRRESLLASSALLLLLSLTLLYGCRAYDPQPPVINRAPDTYVTGGPGETTGTSFTRHMYWYGSDIDGEVVQFIYAITDSTVEDLDDDLNRDEEDDRFNPALDVTTLETTDDRFVGWTAKTDSIFQFTVDRGPISSKRMTFHIVAVDDRGAVDPTPARLYFFNNSLGNPRINFRMFVDVGTGIDPVWELRWTGDVSNASPSSPEQSQIPVSGYERRFRLEWEASSPNGGIIGYRYRTEQGLGSFVPASVQGEKRWDPDANSFEFSNSEAPSSALGVNCRDDASGCDPARVRFPSGNYNISVEALDIALVESDVGTGDLDFGVNYSPETQIILDSQYPRYEVRDASGVLLASSSFVSGDTVPAQSTVLFQSEGYDKFDFALPPGVPADSLCCDRPDRYNPALQPGDPGYVPLVEYQSRLVTTRRVGSDPAGLQRNNSFSTPEQGDTMSFWVGPLDFRYESRTVDEHRRPDGSPEVYRLIGGFKPQVRSDLTVPGGDVVGEPGNVADTLVVAFLEAHFSENEIEYRRLPVTKWFVLDPASDCGGELIPSVPGETPPVGTQTLFGYSYFVKFNFIGQQDPRDPLSPIRAWAFAFFSDKDSLNSIEDGKESRDLSFFTDSPLPNEWTFGQTDEIEFWVPAGLFLNPAPYNPDSDMATERAVGCLVAEHLGNMTLKIRGRTTASTDQYRLFDGTRKIPGSDAPAATVQMGQYGRQSDLLEIKVKFLVGGGSGTVPTFYWPDF